MHQAKRFTNNVSQPAHGSRKPTAKRFVWFTAGSIKDTMYFVYALHSAEDKKFYIGYTENLERRIKEHHSGQNHTTARIKDPMLVYYEAFLSICDARRREGYFKTSKGKKTLRLMLQDTLK